MKNVSLVLREVRDRKGLENGDIARRTGLHASYVCTLLKGETKDPNAPYVYEISRALGTTIDDVMSEAYEGTGELDKVDELASSANRRDPDADRLMGQALAYISEPTDAGFAELTRRLIGYLNDHENDGEEE